MAPGGTQSFYAKVTGSSNTKVSWSVRGGQANGTVTNTGIYTAPESPSGGTYYVVATSDANKKTEGTAMVTVDPPGFLSYQDPSGTGYDFRFIRNAELSTQQHLVLDLVAVNRRDMSVGLAFTLSFTWDPNPVVWAKVGASDSMMVQNGTVFNLGTGRIGLVTTVENDQLKAVVSQKGLSSPHTLNEGILARIALDAVPGKWGTTQMRVLKFQILTANGGIINLDPSTAVAFGNLSISGI